MKVFLALCTLLPLALSKPSTGSYTSFNIGGKSYGYGHDHAHGSVVEPVYYNNPKPTYRKQTKPSYNPKPAYQPQPAYKPQPAFHPAPTYHKPAAPSVPYHQPASYGYEKPKNNCTVQDVTEKVEVCTPTFETTCENVDIAIKKIVDGEYCYDAASTVCTESTEVVPNEVCTYDYQKKYEDTIAQTVDVTFKKETNVQMVTVCQPSYGHGYHSYGHQYCKEVAQETSYNVPVVSPVDVKVRVGYPEPIKTCTNKPIELPILNCEVVTERKCVNQPEIMDSVQSVEKCTTKLGAPNCQQVELDLPKQVCVEIVYGYAEDAPKSYE